MRSIFSLSVHDESISKDDVLLNPALFLPDHTITAGCSLQLTAVKQSSRFIATLQANDRNGPQKLRQNAGEMHEQTMEGAGSGRDCGNEHGIPVDLRRGYYFVAKELEGDVLSRLTGVQISIAWQVAQAFNLKKDDRVIVTEVDEAVCTASHVEIVFRDEYLARADMWHLVTTELAGRTNYKNMKIWSMRTIKASVKNVYVKGEKVQSAIFTASTRPIFRSESARYVLFIQMSKEMWDFDAAGSGEIMFSKAINGFLPELFTRWQQLNAKHLVTIVLFTRIEYNRPRYGKKFDKQRDTEDEASQHTADDPYRDFYRVVVSDMASGDWAGILGQLKAEFKVFLRDVCICHPVPGHYFTLGSSYTAASTPEMPEWVISGRPCSASRGNILEAINLASSQFLIDYIDRDLVRTGVSITVVTPGAGVFEVDDRQLLATTNNLVANGVRIDLVCLSRMPLHSVPLFKYRASDAVDMRATPSGESKDRPRETAFGSAPSAELQDRDSKANSEFLDQWTYAIPHWIDVSFWTSASDEVKAEKTTQEKSLGTPSHMRQPRKAFRPRVRMYELQMMGIMEDTMDDISIPYLPSTSSRRQSNGGKLVSQKFPLAGKASFGEVSGSIASQTNSHSSKLWAPTNARNYRSSGIKDAYHFMNDYDERVFLHPRMTLKTRKSQASLESQQLTKPISLHGVQGKFPTHEVGEHGSLPSGAQAGFRHRDFHDDAMDIPMQSLGKDKQSGSSSTQQRTGLLPKPARFSRQISFGLRGFGATPPKAVASTELFAEHAKSPSLLRRTLRSRELPSPEESVPVGALHRQTLGINQAQESGMTAAELAQSSDSESHTLSRPILIRKNTAIRISDDTSVQYKENKYTYSPAAPWASHKRNPDPATRPSTTNATQMQEEEATPICEEHRDSLDSMLDRLNVAPESTASTPWLTVLNPCNPPKTDVSVASRLGRWQHIFPRPLRASKIKWKSLCSPASVPITTDDFPTDDQLTTGYQQSSYTITPANDHELSEQARSRDWLIREMTAIRLSHGFQIVTGSGAAQFLRQPGHVRLDVFDKNLFVSNDIVIYLSKSNEIHQMKYVENGKIEITCFSRAETIARAANASPPSSVYKPAIRTMLAKEYIPREINLYQKREDFDWRKLDSFLAETGKQQPASTADSLRFWRARFVLIPVDPPANSRRPLQSLNEDSEEEMRLEGIQRLTQIWQKFRYISPEERRFQVALRRRKDTNPLDIMYQTRNPSAIVAAERENIGGSEFAGGAVELLPESELLQRSNLNLASLAQTIQSDKGISMVDRRWHWRLHYSCFIGFELTTWLLQNFRDIDTREEAVELGNELMDNGLFQHVEQRHNFRDGNYFYQIAGDYRTPRPESRSWFGARKSVPPTPISEVPDKILLNPPESRLSSSKGETNTNDTPKSKPVGNKQKLGVALSKSLLYDVDHRKRSYRRELITLHYDRLHNPDNCYHIRIDWMNVTSKLIEDAIISWATVVDKYGLKLVEVPLGEASAVTDAYPFRAPYLVELARSPPSQQPQSAAYFDTKSFSPQSSNDGRFYQKAILKKFQYVLDFEAASDFPSDVDVAYSWGVPDYKYAQYIHRSGALLVQITDEGRFLLLANRLYTNRVAVPQETAQETIDFKLHTYRSNAYRGSPRASPFSSPKVRPTTDVPTFVPQVSSHTTPELLITEFEAFCQDTAALDAFYDETLHKPMAPKRHTLYAESSIPTLGLPPGLELRHKPSASEITKSAKDAPEGAIPTRTGADAPENDSFARAPNE